MTDVECVEFLQWALPRLKLRWRGFRTVRRQVCKRIGRRVKELGLQGGAAYRAFLEATPSEWAVLDGLCRVTISRFYRDRAVFDCLRERLLPELARGAAARGEPALRCWSAGCASGEEPYTLAILFRLELRPRFSGLGLEVVATDSDERVLARARRGCYASATLRELPARWVEEAFTREGDESCVRPELREGVTLRCEDIRERMPDGPFHLVLCRNLVFTYFDVALQQRLLRRMVARLAPGGALVIGAHEALPEEATGLTPAAGHLPIYRVPPVHLQIEPRGPPAGVETEQDVRQRKELLRRMGYKL